MVHRGIQQRGPDFWDPQAPRWTDALCGSSHREAHAGHLSSYAGTLPLRSTSQNLSCPWLLSDISVIPHIPAVTVIARCSNPLPPGPPGATAVAGAGAMTGSRATPAPSRSQATATNRQPSPTCRACPAPSQKLALPGSRQQSWRALPRHPGQRSRLLQGPYYPSMSTSVQASTPQREGPFFLLMAIISPQTCSYAEDITQK